MTTTALFLENNYKIWMMSLCSINLQPHAHWRARRVPSQADTSRARREDDFRRALHHSTQHELEYFWRLYSQSCVFTGAAAMVPSWEKTDFFGCLLRKLVKASHRQGKPMILLISFIPPGWSMMSSRAQEWHFIITIFDQLESPNYGIT